METRAGMMKPELIVGAISGVVLSLPYIRMVNCLCCAGVIATGLIAGWSYSKACNSAGAPFSAASGAKIGLLSGAISAVVSFVLTIILDKIIGQPDGAMLLEAILNWMESNPDIPEEQLIKMEDQLENARSGNIPTSDLIQRFIFGPLLSPLFGLLGGLMAGSLFKDKDTTPPAQPTTPAE